jgi:NTP pyrophosphatase (non-canonical NTP hydrolase)
MDFNEYQELAARTDSGAHKGTTTELAIAALGLTGESGEFADHVKKHLEQGHPLDEDKLIKELGDIQYYIAKAARWLGLTLEEIAANNIDKLRRRYPDGFDPERSMNRAGEGGGYDCPACSVPGTEGHLYQCGQENMYICERCNRVFQAVETEDGKQPELIPIDDETERLSE